MHPITEYYLKNAKEVWDKPNPNKKSKTMSSKQKAKAKARAKKSGRPYPNLVDNMWASKSGEDDVLEVWKIGKQKMEGMRMGKHLSRSGGMTEKGVKKFRRDNPGSKLQTAVTTKPSKLKKDSKDAKRRKSFCARMSGVKGPMKDEKGRPTRKAKALRKWNC